jgi:hypothetical protein
MRILKLFSGAAPLLAWGIVSAVALTVQAVCQPAPADKPRLPDEFPASLWRPVPVEDLNQAVVFTMNEATASDYAVDLSRRTGSDLLIRGWFKWGQAPPVQQWQEALAKLHQLGALFGGGITCSALYDGENGLTQAQLLDMATRGRDGQLVNAWGQAGIRHGSLSSPAYLDYLFRWCREQVDAGVDCLFMDEHTAARQSGEGFDDHSLNDFRVYLLEHHRAARGWAPDDARWERPSRNLFTVGPDGSVAHGDELNGFLQGRLHAQLGNPPTFLVNATAPGRLLVHVRAVAAAGARLEYRVDGQAVRAVALPDRDGKNDSGAAEYDQVLSLPIPAGAHRLTLDNMGPDWLGMTGLEFQGSFGPAAPGGPGGE